MSSEQYLDPGLIDDFNWKLFFFFPFILVDDDKFRSWIHSLYHDIITFRKSSSIEFNLNNCFFRRIVRVFPLLSFFFLIFTVQFPPRGDFARIFLSNHLLPNRNILELDQPGYSTANAHTCIRDNLRT